MEMNKDRAKALFILAGFEVKQLFELVNEYCKVMTDVQPWWLAKTQFGWIKIGWRKRVIHIEWTETGEDVSVTEDDVTKNGFCVHAWGYPKALEYLTSLRVELEKRADAREWVGDGEG